MPGEGPSKRGFWHAGERPVSRSVESMADKQALSPGSMVHVGRPRGESVGISVIDYDPQGAERLGEVDEGQLGMLKEQSKVTWFKVDGVHQVEVIHSLGEIFGLHPLVQEDIVNTHQRPKMEVYGDYIFIVTKHLYFEDDGELASEQISLVLGRGYLVSFQESAHDPFAPVVQRITEGQGRIRQHGADYLAYALMDAVVDSYYQVLEELGDREEELEEELLTDPDRESLVRLQDLKHMNQTLRKAARPLREVAWALDRGETDLVSEHITVFLRDLYDHVLQVVEACETRRDTLAGLMDIYLSSVSNRMNEVMKVLTIIATIFIPLTFIAGVYGMNFDYMPELKWHWAYFACLALMAGLAGLMVLYFRIKKWL